jgi:NADH-quinone oxidoreductase subunit M
MVKAIIMLLPLLISPLLTFLLIIILIKVKSNLSNLSLSSLSLVLTLTLALSLLNLIHAQLLVLLFDPISIGLQFMMLTLGLDGVSLMLIWLVTLLMPIVLLSLGRVKLLLLIGFWSLAVFMTLDLFYFYISFEGVLIPMFFLIGFYGGRNRKIQAAYSFFIYTLLGSMMLFLALLVLYYLMGSTSFEQLLHLSALNSLVSKQSQLVLWLAFFLSLAIKVPIMPFHLWLIDAHVESPTAGSVLLAAILLKLGSYGFIRFSLPLFKDASCYFSPLINVIAIMGVIYASVACLSQLDLKKIIAYSSIAHMNLSLVGLFSNDFTGISSSIYFIISHGLISAGLFLLIGVLYDRLHTRTYKYFRGLVLLLPTFIWMMLCFTLANAAVPMTSGFVGEFYVLVSCVITSSYVSADPLLTLLISTAIVLTPAYALLLFHRIAYGKLSRHLILLVADLTHKDFHMLCPLLAFTVIFGIFPNQLFSLLHWSTLNLFYSYNFIDTKCMV